MFEAAPLFQAETTAAAFGCARRVWFTCALAAAVLVLGGCFRKFHLRLPVTIEVVDGLTGLPVEGAFISQGKTVGKFDPKIDRSVATTGPDGTARFVVLCWMDGTYWQIFAGDPMLPDNLKTEGGASSMVAGSARFRQSSPSSRRITTARRSGLHSRS